MRYARGAAQWGAGGAASDRCGFSRNVGRDLTAIDTPRARYPTYIPATTYFVNAEPASLSEAGPSAT